MVQHRDRRSKSLGEEKPQEKAGALNELDMLEQVLEFRDELGTIRKGGLSIEIDSKAKPPILIGVNPHTKALTVTIPKPTKFEIVDEDSPNPTFCFPGLKISANQCLQEQITLEPLPQSDEFCITFPRLPAANLSQPPEPNGEHSPPGTTLPSIINPSSQNDALEQQPTKERDSGQTQQDIVENEVSPDGTDLVPTQQDIVETEGSPDETDLVPTQQNIVETEGSPDGTDLAPTQQDIVETEGSPDGTDLAPTQQDIVPTDETPNEASPGVECPHLAVIKGVYRQGSTVTVKLEEAWEDLIANIGGRYADSALGGIRALEQGLFYLTEPIFNQLMSAVEDNNVSNSLRQIVAEQLTDGGLEQPVSKAFFGQIDSDPNGSLSIFHSHTLKTARLTSSDDAELGQESHLPNGGKVLVDSTLADRLIGEHLLKPIISEILGNGIPKSTLYLSAQDGETLLPLLRSGFNATFLETNSPRLAELVSGIKRTTENNPTISIDFAQLDFKGAWSILQTRPQRYDLVLLPELSNWGEDLPVSYLNQVKPLILNGGHLILPCGAFEEGDLRPDLPAIQEFCSHLNSDQFFKKCIERELVFVIPQNAGEKVRSAFVDLVCNVRSRYQGTNRESVERELKTKLLIDGSYRFALQLRLYQFTKTGESQSPAVSQPWPSGKWTDFPEVDNTDVNFTAGSSPLVIDGGVSFELMKSTEESPQSPVEGAELVNLSWPIGSDLDSDNLFNIEFHGHPFDLVRTEPDITKASDREDHQKLWNNFYKTQRELWLTLLSSWPVQERLLQLIVDNSSAAPGNSHRKLRRSLERYWLEAAQQYLWPLIKKDAQKLLDRTRSLIDSVDNFKTTGKANPTLVGQLKINCAYLNRINVPYDYRHGEYERIRRLPTGTLTEQAEFLELINRLNVQSKNIANALVSANIGLIRSVAFKFNKGSLQAGELDSEFLWEGYHGVTRAIELFNFKNKFTTYAHRWIRQAIFNTIKERSNLSYTDRYYLSQKRALMARLGRKPTQEDLVESLVIEGQRRPGQAEAFVRKRELITVLRSTPRSLHSTVGPKKDVELIDLLSAASSANRGRTDYEQLKPLLIELWQPLPEDYRHILFLRYCEGHTLQHYAQSFGVTRELVRQKEWKGLDYVLVDGHPAYRKINQCIETGRAPSKQNSEPDVYISQVVSDTKLIFSLLRSGIFTVKQLKRYSSDELEFTDYELESLKAYLSKHCVKLASSVATYSRDQISPQSIGWLPPPARAKILMGVIASHQYESGYLKDLFERWISVLPQTQKKLATSYMPHSRNEGLRFGQGRGVRLNHNQRSELLQVLTALGHSDCPTVKPVYSWISDGDCDDLNRPIEGLISNVSAISPKIAITLVSRGIYTLRQLSRTPLHRLEVIKFKPAELELIMQIANRNLPTKK